MSWLKTDRPRVALGVVGAVRVLATVALYDDARIEAYEVGDVGAERDLSAELQPAELAAAQKAPQAPFSRRLIVAHGAGAVPLFFLVRHGDEAGTRPGPVKPLILPTPLARRGPLLLPQGEKGRGRGLDDV